jgi:HAD superfamily hydrolase (TIGR01484 family)
MADIRFIAIDLDGTLMGSAEEFHLYSQFRETLHNFLGKNNAVWAICTGRSLKSFQRFFSPMQMMGITPNYVILKHAFIYSLTRFGYRSHILWNLWIRYLLWTHLLNARTAIDECEELVFRFTHRATLIRKAKDRIWVRFESEQVSSAAADMLSEKVKSCKNLRMFRFIKEIDIRAVPFTKGLSVSELSRHIGINRENVLAIGDGHNDLSMLDGSAALYTGCPANAAPEVMELVHKQGGHIAKGRSLAGVLEILNAYETGAISSDLPAEWKNPETSEKSRPIRSHPKSKHHNVFMNWCIFVAVTYAVLLAFANFSLIPYVSGLIMLPYRLLLSLIQKIINSL